MDGFMGAGVHAFGAAKRKAAIPSPKAKGVVKAAPKASGKASPKKAGGSPKKSPAKKSNACA